MERSGINICKRAVIQLSMIYNNRLLRVLASIALMYGIMFIDDLEIDGSGHI
jgi:hypothetical protein